MTKISAFAIFTVLVFSGYGCRQVGSSYNEPKALSVKSQYVSYLETIANGLNVREIEKSLELPEPIEMQAPVPGGASAFRFRYDTRWCIVFFDANRVGDDWGASDSYVFGGNYVVFTKEEWRKEMSKYMPESKAEVKNH